MRIKMMEFESDSNIYFCIMKTTMDNVHQNYENDEECALELLWEMWKTKMQHVSVHTINTGIELRNAKQRCRRISQGTRKRSSDIARIKKEKSTPVCNIETPPTSPGLSMPCLDCNELMCIHLSPDYREIMNASNFTQKHTVSTFQKIKISRSLQVDKNVRTVKITLPTRSKNINENRTCVIQVPAALRSHLKSIISPVISKIGQYSTSRAAVMLQRHFNNTCSKIELSQLDGASDCKIRIISKKFAFADTRNLDNSDIDSEDDQSDSENIEDAFNSENILLCLFDSVQHKGNDWHLNLKHCIMQACGKHYIFHEANGITKF